MKPSTHKTIVFAGFGCAGVLVALVAVALLFAPADVRRASFETHKDPDRYTGEQSAAALDSLRELADAWSAPRAGEAGGGPWPAGPELGGAALAASVASGEYPTAPLPLGDTFPEDARQRWQWLAARSLPVVDSLLALARRAAPSRGGRAAAPPDAGAATASLAFSYIASRALSATHALLARARYELDTGRVATADEAVRAVLAIGRSLEQDSVLARTLLGARIERDAWRLLVGAPPLARRITRREAAAELARVDSLADGLRAVWRLAPAAGSDAANCEPLESLVRESRLPLAVRREMVLAIAYGWIYDPPEMTYGLSRKRRDSVARLAGADLAPQLGDAVRAAEAVLRLGIAQRMTRAVEYRMMRSAHAGL